MKKKTLFLALSAVVFIFPIIALAEQSLPEMVDGIAEVAVLIGVGVVVIGWTVAGIMFLLSFGSPEKMGTAKKALIYSIIGTVLIILAQSGYATLKAILNNVFQGK